MLHRSLFFLFLAAMTPAVLSACLDRPDTPIGDGVNSPIGEEQDEEEDLWDDPFWNSDDDDSAIDGQLGTVSFAYNFFVNSDDYWDCQRSYRWMELPDPAAAGCADCLSTWRIEYQLLTDTCGTYGWNGNGYQLSSGLDPVKNWLWFTHDEGQNWLRFPGQGSMTQGTFEASWTWTDDCFDTDSDGNCDPGSEMNYRELFELHW